MFLWCNQGSRVLGLNQLRMAAAGAALAEGSKVMTPRSVNPTRVFRVLSQGFIDVLLWVAAATAGLCIIGFAARLCGWLPGLKNGTGNSTAGPLCPKRASSIGDSGRREFEIEAGNGNSSAGNQINNQGENKGLGFSVRGGSNHSGEKPHPNPFIQI